MVGVLCVVLPFFGRVQKSGIIATWLFICLLYSGTFGFSFLQKCSWWFELCFVPIWSLSTAIGAFGLPSSQFFVAPLWNSTCRWFMSAAGSVVCTGVSSHLGVSHSHLTRRAGLASCGFPLLVLVWFPLALCAGLRSELSRLV